MQTINSFKFYLILLLILLFTGCATSMKMTPTELRNLAPNEGVIVGSLIVKGGKDLLGRTKWELVAKNDSGMFSKQFSITANRDEGEEIFASKLPAGDYNFSELRQTGFSTFKAKTNLRFTVQPNKPVYIGRIVIEFPPGLINMSTKFHIKVDDAKEDVMEKVSNLYGINLNNVASAIAFGGT